MEQTLIILKPDAVQKNLVDVCLKRFRDAGLNIKEEYKTKLSRKFLDNLYRHLEGKINNEMLENIKNWMCSDYVHAAVLDGEDAIKKVRKICGSTNPKEAGKGTLRGDYSNEDMRENAKYNRELHNIVHASGSRQEAEEEIELFRRFMGQ
ncbi:MAG: nucleoside-diphosphate kinase [archaeon]